MELESDLICCLGVVAMGESLTGLPSDGVGDVCNVGDDFCDFCDLPRVPEASGTMCKGPEKLKTLSETMGEGTGTTGTESEAGDC